MIKPVDYSFPKVFPSTEHMFSLEIKKLTEIWNACCRAFEQSATIESQHKNEYRYKNHRSILEGLTCISASGALCVISGLCNPLGEIAFGCGMFSAIIADASHHGVDENYTDFRIRSHRTIEKVERCVRLLNALGELYASWELDDSNNLLFDNFNRVQKAEVGVLTHEKDSSLSLLSIYNPCDARIQVDNKVARLRKFIHQEFTSFAGAH